MSGERHVVWTGGRTDFCPILSRGFLARQFAMIMVTGRLRFSADAVQKIEIKFMVGPFPPATTAINGFCSKHAETAVKPFAGYVSKIIGGPR